MQDDEKTGPVLDLIIENMNFPRGGAAVTADVLFYMNDDRAWDRDGAMIRIQTVVPWERKEDRMEDVREALVKSAHRLLKAAASLSEEDLRRLLTDGLAEDLLPELHDRAQH